ncbi:MAG: hypothetical protein K2F94_08295 [Muribaculaceae bacterium]|nr:hypothetical protein [Muribaculaceae bacterium]MDE6399904.1 hypothetical protein [Muribaculaceae bacterium]MDE6533268.1 hypothetical protein [Muribaculaceae bacterium]
MRHFSFLFVFLAAILTPAILFSQTAHKPTIMVVPARDWCQRNGYTDNYGNCDYRKALSNPDMLSAIATIGDMMAGENYPLLSLEQILDNIDNEEVYDLLLKSKDDGLIVESDIDRLARAGRADMMVEMSLDNKRRGPNSFIEFRVTSVDAASGKIIHGDVGASSASAAPMSILVKESVKGFMPNFYLRIDNHFNTLANEGREGTIVFKIADDCPLNLEETVTINGESGELAEYLDYWLGENCVNGAHTPSGKSRVRMAFNQVRIPLFGKAKTGGFGSSKGKVKALDAESFIKGISPDLEALGISMSTTPIGLGKVLVTLGGL